MKVFKYWLIVDLDLGWKAPFEIIAPSEITDAQHPYFDAKVAHIKKMPGIRWEMHDFSDTLVEQSHPPKEEKK